MLFGRIRLSLGLFLLICLSANTAGAAIPPWEIDGLLHKDAPAFQVTDLSGKEISNKTLRGEVVLLNFWATWCGPCREEMPDLRKLQRRFKDDGLQVVGIAVDSSKAMVERFLVMMPVAFPVAVDSAAKIADSYKVYTYPTTFLLDRHGVIQAFYLGSRQWDEPAFVEKIKTLLAADKGTAGTGAGK